MKRAAVSLALLLSVSPAFAASSRASRGTAAATFLSLGGGARAAGLAGAATSSTEGASSLVWNAAAPAGIAAPEVEAMHGDWFENSNYDFASVAVPFGPGLGVGVSYQQFTVGSLERRDGSGFEDGTFKPQDSAIGLNFSGTVGGYLMGVTAKSIRSKIVSSASTYAADLGVMSPEISGRRWGLSASNIGGRLKYDVKKENLPSTIALGGTQRFGLHSVSADFKFPRDNNPYLSVGAEGGLAMGGGLVGLGRVGYSTRSGAESGSLAGLSVGAGVKARYFSIDYAFAPFGDLGSVHIISLALRGGGKAAQ